MTERVWCRDCEKVVSDDHDGALCHNCGGSFCDSRGDVQLGICESCAAELAKKQSQ